MALDNYSDLKSSIENWVDDSSITSYTADFVSLAESAMKHDKDTRFLANEVRATATLSSGEQYLALPTGFSRIKRIHLTGSPQQVIEVVSSSVLNDYYTSTTGKPKYAAIVDDQFEFNRLADSDYTVEIIYYKFSDLSDSNTTNEIFPKYKNIYLYGSLVQAAIFIKDRELQSDMMAMYKDAVNTAKNADKSSRYAGSLRSRVVNV